jgi:hypothetical protein
MQLPRVNIIDKPLGYGKQFIDLASNFWQFIALLASTKFGFWVYKIRISRGQNLICLIRLSKMRFAMEWYKF